MISHAMTGVINCNIWKDIFSDVPSTYQSQKPFEFWNVCICPTEIFLWALLFLWHHKTFTQWTTWKWRFPNRYLCTWSSIPSFFSNTSFWSGSKIKTVVIVNNGRVSQVGFCRLRWGTLTDKGEAPSHSLKAMVFWLCAYIRRAQAIWCRPGVPWPRQQSLQ